MPNLNGVALLPPLEVTVYGDPLDDRELSATVLRVQQRRKTLVAIKRHRMQESVLIEAHELLAIADKVRAEIEREGQ